MPTFTVSTQQGKGYIASNSVSATRINTPIKDLPFSVSAFTQQFITDIGASDLGQVAQYASGVTSGARQQVNGNAAYMIRGFLQAPQTNGFATPQANPTGGPYVDTVAVEQVEVVKGPASVLYGQVAPGGTVNYITKRGRDEPFTAVSVRAGSYDFLRSTVDINQPIFPGKLLFRINAAYENGFEYYEPATNSKTTVIVPTLTWRITDRLTLMVELQDFKRREAPFVNILPSNQIVAPPNATTGILPSNSVLQDPLDQNNFGFVGYYPLPRKFNFNSVNDWRRTHFQTFTAEIKAELGERWVARANFISNTSYSGFKQTGFTNVNIDVPASYTSRFPTYAEAARAFAQDILLNPAVALQAPHAQMPQTLFVRETPGDRTSVQGEAVAQYDLSWAKVRPLMGFYYDGGIVHNRRRQTSANGTYQIYTAPSAANRVNPPPPWDFVNQAQFPINYNTDFDPATLPLTVWDANKTYNRAVYGLLNITSHDRRLTAIVGARYNQSDARLINYLVNPAVRDPVGPRFDSEKVTPQLAVGYKPRRDTLLFASYSESFEATSFFVNLIDPVPAKPIVSKGYEVGLKLDLLGGRISSTVSVFSIEQRDRVFSLNALDAAGVLRGARFQGTVDRSRGIEADITYSPTDNWQVFASVSQNDVRVIETFPGLEFYVGSTPQNVAKTLANLWTRYSFTGGALEGFWIGGGVKYTSRKAGNQVNPSYWLPGNTLYSLAASYEWKWSGNLMSATINWDNVTDVDYLPAIQDRGLPSRATLTVTAKF